MTVKTLLCRLSDGNPGVSKIGARDMLEQVVEAFAAELVAGREVRLSGLGTLYAVDRVARKGAHPRTGERFDIAAKRLLKIRTGKVLSDRLNPAR